MFDLIRKVIKQDKTPVKTSSGSIQERTKIAACVLLLEAAHIDEECTDEELDHVFATLKNHFSLSQQCVEELIELSHKERHEAVDLWEFTSHMNQHFTKTEKIAVMEAVWRIIHTDGRLDKHEDHFAHKLANLLRLTHKELIDAKVLARKQI
ncbi:TerB family tellurite resistance protein [Thermodesulfobacteriota bacterium]